MSEDEAPGAGARDTREAEASADAEPFPNSLCAACAEVRHVRTRSSVFLRCAVLPVKYPPQPVVRCAAFRPRG